MRKSTIAAIGLAAMLTAQGVAQATDYCFTIPLGHIAVPSFQLPKPGKCSTFKKGLLRRRRIPVLGTACDDRRFTMRMTFLILTTSASPTQAPRVPYPRLGTGPYWFIQSQDETS
jgi:hypothetical protein